MNEADKYSFRPMLMLVMVVAIIGVGCNRNQGADPADANMASAGMQTQGAVNTEAPPPALPASPPEASPQAPAPSYSQDYSQAPASDQSGYAPEGEDQSGYAPSQEEPAEYAPEPPPALPEYDQPECPGDNYIWTPGYWNYAPAGYYWVPGVWVLAPYVGALWTPGYWGFFGNRYGWYQGYWGPHIGFYGGINYGFGYAGRGFYGGYWNHGSFQYNRQVTNVGITRMFNTYSYRVPNATAYNRVSYNGGRGGVNLRPTASENTAIRERHLAPLQSQVQHVQAASTNRALFASVNHGRPATAAMAKPLAAERREPPKAAPARNARPANERVESGQSRPAQREPQRTAEPRQQARPTQQQRPTEQARPAQQREPQRTVEPRQQARPTQQQRPAEQARPVQQREPQRAVEPRQQARPTQQQRPTEQARPQQQREPQRTVEPRQQARPQQRESPRPESRPASKPPAHEENRPR